MKTTNITVRIDEETYHRARITAAERGTSVSAMVREFLVSQSSNAVDPEAQRVAELQALYRKAEARSKPSKQSVKPLSRQEIYADRIR
jgi:plasmid stability protein